MFRRFLSLACILFKRQILYIKMVIFFFFFNVFVSLWLLICVTRLLELYILL